MAKLGKWIFPSNGGGRIDGPNDAALDHFAGTRLSSLIREVVQNSLDAKADKNKAVDISFQLQTLKRNECENLFQDIVSHLDACKEIAQEQNNEDSKHNYDKMIKLINKNEDIPMLCIHDANTTGLTGVVGTSKGSWDALVRGAGISQKQSDSSLGSFGHGSKAPFAVSPLRMIFYYTRINYDKKEEERFQGKCILQSHNWSFSGSSGLTQGTGYYCHDKKNNLLPLLDTRVPEWFRESRNKAYNKIGTSIYIPYFEYSSDNFERCAMYSILANFYYSIHLGEICIAVNDTKLAKGNDLDSCYRYYLQSMERDYRDEKITSHINMDDIQDKFASIETIVKYDHKGEELIDGFGEYEWFLRDGSNRYDQLEGKVAAISRSSGMLITRKPFKLQRFSGCREFDCFIRIKEGEGSSLLKESENPQHDNFEFDRITDKEKRKKLKKKYIEFAKHVRGILDQYVKYEEKEEEVVEDLEDIFNDKTEGDFKSEKGEAYNRGLKVVLLNKPSKKMIELRKSTKKKIEAQQMESGIKSEQSKGGTRKRRGRRAQNSVQATVAHGSYIYGNQLQSLSDLRIVFNNDSKYQTVYFSSMNSGIHKIEFFISGEGVKDEPISFEFNSEMKTFIELDLQANHRHKIENISFPEESREYAIKAVSYMAIQSTEGE